MNVGQLTMVHMFRYQLLNRVHKVSTMQHTAGIALAHFRMLIHELFNKDPDIVSEEAPLIVLDSKSAMCMDNNGKDTKQPLEGST